MTRSSLRSQQVKRFVQLSRHNASLHSCFVPMFWCLDFLRISALFAFLGALGKAPSKVTDALPEISPAAAAAVSDEESEEDIEAMQSRLEALRS